MRLIIFLLQITIIQAAVILKLKADILEVLLEAWMKPMLKQIRHGLLICVCVELHKLTV